jgi:polysaccharide export outer membrane protein
MKKLFSFSGLVFSALTILQLLASCMTETAQTNKPVVANQAATPLLSSGEVGAAQSDEPVVTQRPAIASALASADTPGDYKISPQDILQVAVFQVKDLNNTVQVSQDGNITLALIGKVQLSGKTTHEAEQVIADKLREKYLQSPQVSVSIKQYGKRITVSGEVKTPRVLPDDGGTTLTQAIASAGCLS